MQHTRTLREESKTGSPAAQDWLVRIVLLSALLGGWWVGRQSAEGYVWFLAGLGVFYSGAFALLGAWTSDRVELVFGDELVGVDRATDPLNYWLTVAVSLLAMLGGGTYAVFVAITW